jgi:hypothetical protein
MKLRHRVCSTSAPRNDPEWEERVTREAHEHTAKARRAAEERARRLTRARERLHEAEVEAERAARRRVGRKHLSRLWAAVEARRAELHQVEREMQASPAGSQHRGRRSYRGVGTARDYV